MGINYTNDILPLYATNVVTDEPYSSINPSFRNQTSEQRILTTIEILRAHMASLRSKGEAKAFHYSISKVLFNFAYNDIYRNVNIVVLGNVELRTDMVSNGDTLSVTTESGTDTITLAGAPYATSRAIVADINGQFSNVTEVEAFIYYGVLAFRNTTGHEGTYYTLGPGSGRNICDIAGISTATYINNVRKSANSAMNEALSVFGRSVFPVVAEPPVIVVDPVDLNTLVSRSVSIPVQNNYQTERAGTACIRWNSTGQTPILVPTRGDMIYVRLRIPWSSMHHDITQYIPVLANTRTTSFACNITIKTLGNTDQRQVDFRFTNSSNVGPSGSITTKIPRDKEVIGLGFWVDGNSTSGNLYAAIIDGITGTQIGSTETVAHSSFSGANLFFYHGIGARVHESTGAIQAVNAANFDIDMFGIYTNGNNTGTLTDPLNKLISLIMGENPNTVFGGNNLHAVCRRWSDPTDLDTPVIDSEYVIGTRPSPNFEAITTGGATLLDGGNVGAQTSSKYLVITPPPENEVYPIEYGATQATITLTGTSSLADDEVIEAQIFSEEDGTVTTDWVPVAIVASNAFTVDLSANATKYMANIRFRSSSNPDDTDLQYIVRRPFGIGAKVPILSQSQGEFFLWKESEALDARTLSDPTIKQVSVTLTDNLGDTNERIATIMVDDRYTPMAEGVLAFAKRWAELTTMPIQLVHMSQSATTQAQIADDSFPERDWQDLVNVSAVVGPYYSVIYDLGFGTSQSTSSSTNFLDDIISKFYMGDGVTAGDTITLDNATTYNVDHSIFGLNGGTANDHGVFNSDGWDLRMIIPPLTRHGEATDRTPTSDESENGGLLTSFRRYRQVREAQIASWDVYDEILPGKPINDIYTDSDSFGYHQKSGSPYGHMRTGARIAEGIAEGLGVTSDGIPVPTGATVSGGVITVAIDTKSLGVLTTDAAITGGTIPVGYQPIGGFEVSEDGGTTWSLTGFEPSISGSNVLLTKNGGANWAASPQVRFLFGAPNARDIGDDPIVHSTLLVDRSRTINTDFDRAVSGAQVLGPWGPVTAI